MTSALRDRIEGFLDRRAGLELDATRWSRVEEHATRTMHEHGLDQGRYLAIIEGGSELGRRLADELLCTVLVHETFFYRYSSQLASLSKDILPAIVGQARGELRIWSAGCSEGAEPYTLAMLAARAAQDARSDIRISVLGTDVCTAFLDKARKGVFRNSKLAELPADLAERFIERVDDGHFCVARGIFRLVTFARHNLMDPPLQKDFAIVSCRNVLMYLRPDPLRSAIENLSRALAPAGYLLVGHAESLRRHADLLAPDRRFCVGIYRHPGATLEVTRPGASGDVPNSCARAPAAVTDIRTAVTARPPGPIRLEGDYDAHAGQARLEKLKQALAGLIDSGTDVLVEADGATSLDATTGRLIARAARLASSRGQSLVVKARRERIRRWALDHGLPLESEGA